MKVFNNKQQDQQHGPLDDFPRYFDTSNNQENMHPLWFTCKKWIENSGFDLSVWSSNPYHNETDKMVIDEVLAR